MGNGNGEWRMENMDMRLLMRGFLVGEIGHWLDLAMDASLSECFVHAMLCPRVVQRGLYID